MVDRVFVHIGLPKTATTYLQTIIWANRERLREEGVVVPGAERRDHLWASRTVREEGRQEWAPEHQRTAWDRLRAELAESEGTGLISHEFFAAARPVQAKAMVAQLAPAEVHLVISAREPLGLFSASWQESLKNGSTLPMSDYGRYVSVKPTDIWNWRTLDLRLVLKRWTKAVPQDRVHVLVLDPGAPREDVWHKLAAAVGFSGDDMDLSSTFPNASMGVVQAETLRRINGKLEGFGRAYERGVYIRSFLADERLVPQGGDRFWPDPDQIEECRVRGADAVEHLREGDYDIHGDLEQLLVPADLEPRRSTSSVTDAEVGDVAAQLVATMLGDVRRLSEEVRTLESLRDEDATDDGRLGSFLARARARISRDGPDA
ncbi:hypothetical protein [Nocardioides sp.]|uniref:hypothetical protein n=1 Tax=Nocardioides sp. TaxID=35761 RepID=UPI00271DEAC6|nr:hypothetical protein [Nocardioides sp.]MDO9456140.1 hypothetical protein [Nocardioides sp.]